MSRPRSSTRATATLAVSVDVVLLGCNGGRLHLALDSESPRPSLPYGAPGKSETLDAAAVRIARRESTTAPQWIEQVGAFSGGATHPGRAMLSVCYVAVTPMEKAQTWQPVNSLSGLADPQRRMLGASVAAIRSRLEQAPVAFSMLPRAFTLSELQDAYETILGRRLHKASFRRALQSASLVVPTGEIRAEGRGRPAQLFRYAPAQREKSGRGVRFEHVWRNTRSGSAYGAFEFRSRR